MVEGRVFAVYTDHEPLVHAFEPKQKNASPRQARHFDFIAQLTTDIRYVKGNENVVADALSRVEEIQEGIDYEQLAEEQSSDAELRNIIHSDSSLQIKLIQWLDTRISIYCDTSTGKARPFLTKSFRRKAFDTVHNLSHPGVKATTKLITHKFVWPSIKFDCRQWAKTCIDCQKSKVTRHVTAPIGEFEQPTQRFQHVHMDIIIMPYCRDHRYCLTMIDRFTRWPEVVPLKDQEAVTIAKEFYQHWVVRFGVPLRVTTDQGRQFESHLFKQLNALLGTKHIRTTAYHPAANGMIERLHRQLKAALKCHSEDWINALPSVLLGIRTAWKEDLNTTSAELVYGQSLCIPGELLISAPTNVNTEPFVRQLKIQLQSLRPTPSRRHGERKIFVHKDLATCSHVFVRHDATKAPLQQPYNGPYYVISRSPYYYNIDIQGKETSVSINRLKPAFIDQDVPETYQQGQIIHQQEQAPEEDAETYATPPGSPAIEPERPQSLRTRYGRSVKFTQRYQAGFS